MPTEEVTPEQDMAIEAYYHLHKLAMKSIKSADKLSALIGNEDSDKACRHAVKSLFEIGLLAKSILNNKP